MLNYSPEEEFGNIEYKLSLVNKSVDRLEHLTSQMRMRIGEGGGEAIYVIGVTDDGEIKGVSEAEFKESLNNLSIIANKNDYSITILLSKDVEVEKKVYELLIREHNTKTYIDIKVAIAGNVDSGKSTLLGVLTSGKNDDGRGSARLSIFNFKHEVSSGRTSSIAHHILGFDDKGCVMNYSGSYDSVHKKGWGEIVRDSSKIISFYDLCGHEKYIRTTILGLTSSSPDLCLILVGANMGLTRMTQEHIFLCVTLNIPFAIVLTKIDICVDRKDVMKDTMRSLNSLLKMPGIRRIPYKINNTDDVIICAKNVLTDSIVPIFPVSSKLGTGVDFLKEFLNLLGRKQANIREDIKSVEMHIDTTFSVAGVGTVVGGHLLSGNVKVGDKLLLGPNDGVYKEVCVRSIHCKRVPMQDVKYGSYVCLGLKKIDRSCIRRGNVIISKESKKIALKEFDVDITVLKAHSTTIKLGYEPVIHTHTIRQSAKLISITKKVNARNGYSETNDESFLRSGDKASVRFRFAYNKSEYIKAGDIVLMSEGKCKMVGIVK
jgi:GTPase